jgi:hypothetical protein
MSRYVPALLLIVLAALIFGATVFGESGATVPPARAPATAPTKPTAAETNASKPAGKDVVMLDELVHIYEPVPFLHRRHAAMSDMSGGCTTCHHHTPEVTSQPATRPAGTVPDKQDTATFPECKTCHPVDAKEASIRMPTLKGAYHRQCLDCHRDWMDQNACSICHAPRKTGASLPTSATAPAPQPDDILGRMHKPIPEPGECPITARLTPVAGAKVLFRHNEHVKSFGIKCVSCHRHDSCSNCHADEAATNPSTHAETGRSPMKPGRTWKETHDPCISCHQKDTCNHCHYEAGKAAPAAFDHKTTGQTFDKDHDKLACVTCHPEVRVSAPVSCGEASCHKTAVAFPAKRPGPYTAPLTPPATRVATTTHATSQATTTTAPATSPSTRPTLIRIRRGGL